MNSKIVFIYPLPALLNPLALTPFTTEEIIGYTIEVAKSANKASRNPSFYLFIFFFIF